MDTPRRNGDPAHPPLAAEDEQAAIAARCHEIQVCLGTTEVPEYESVVEIGMGVRLALHLRGLTLLPFETVRLVAIHYLGVPGLSNR